MNGPGGPPEPGSDACVPDHQENLPHAGGPVLDRPDRGLHPGQRLRVCCEPPCPGAGCGDAGASRVRSWDFCRECRNDDPTESQYWCPMTCCEDDLEACLLMWARLRDCNPEMFFRQHGGSGGATNVQHLVFCKVLVIMSSVQGRSRAAELLLRPLLSSGQLSSRRAAAVISTGSSGSSDLTSCAPLRD